MEKRGTKRKEATNLVTVDFPDEGDRPTGVQLGRTLNINRDGASIEITSSARFSISVGTELLLTIGLGEKAIPLRGRVVHGRQANERQVVVGVLFTEILPDDRRALVAFLWE